MFKRGHPFFIATSKSLYTGKYRLFLPVKFGCSVTTAYLRENYNHMKDFGNFNTLSWTPEMRSNVIAKLQSLGYTELDPDSQVGLVSITFVKDEPWIGKLSYMLFDDPFFEVEDNDIDTITYEEFMVL